MFPRTIPRAGHLRPVFFQAWSSPISLPELFPGPRKGNVAQRQGRLQRLDRQLMPLERFSMDEKQELVDKPSSSFLTPHSNDSEGCSRVCLSEELQQDRAQTAHSTTCPSVHTFPSCPFHQNLPLPHCASPHLILQLPVPQSLCPGLLWQESKLEELADFTNSYISKAILVLLSPCRASWLGIEFLLHYGTQSNYCY